ncbi:MAG: 3-deoxy-D-manno-octulosonic acid transferase [Flavobacteriales bacterium]|nr:3-deoxy-D-manno-octulosonic acid transferase [Flavobacteriales bacterium]
MKILYLLSIYFYRLIIRILSPFHSKAALWIHGRKSWRGRLEKIPFSEHRILFHCASLGEFEMIRPIIEWMKINKPDYQILISFFSPSGYEVRKHYDKADAVFYLPSDTPKNAKDFARILRPEMVVFAKYEFWHFHLNALKASGAKLFAVSAVFRTNHRFFKWYGSMFRNDLRLFDSIFVQDTPSQHLLKSIGIESVLAGDTRFDRVYANAETSKPIVPIENWINHRRVIVAGSSWPQEEQRMVEAMKQIDNENLCWIIVPHDVSEAHISELQASIPVSSVRFTRWKNENTAVMIIDNVGMLMSVYRYAHLAIVGGGFSGKLHNILEPAAFGIPVLFGPKHDRFREADEMIKAGAAYEFDGDLKEQLSRFISDETLLEQSGRAAKEFVMQHLGATDRVVNGIFG